MLQPTIKNRTIFCKDNLDILQNINSDTIDLIYLDPPFNKKKMFHASIGSAAEGASFKDIFRKEDIKDEWIEGIQQDNVALYGLLDFTKKVEGKTSYNFCYIAYISIRLLEMHRILKETASLYLHCDPTMGHYLKLVMDCIFGEKNFRNEINWLRTGVHNDSNKYGNSTDTLLFYTKTDKYLFNKGEANKNQSHKEIKKKFNKVDQKGSYRIDRLDARGLQGGGYTYNYKGIEDLWRVPLRKMVDLEKNDLIHWTKKRPYKKTYLDENTQKKALQDLWDDIRTTQKLERTGYPTQKPVALLERILKASSNKGDIILDPFCGCATTCIAAEKLNRKWIGIDVSHKAFDLVKKRLEKEVQGEKENGERDLLNYKKEVHYTTIPPKRTDQGKDNLLKKYVYVISNPKYKGEYKVGIAKDYKARLNSYQTSDPDRNYQLEYTVYTPLFREIEKYIHNKFQNKHEWVSGKLENIIKAIENYKV